VIDSVRPAADEQPVASASVQAAESSPRWRTTIAAAIPPTATTNAPIASSLLVVRGRRLWTVVRRRHTLGGVRLAFGQASPVAEGRIHPPSRKGYRA
jgi:hypothetical protein